MAISLVISQQAKETWYQAIRALRRNQLRKFFSYVLILRLYFFRDMAVMMLSELDAAERAGRPPSTLDNMEAGAAVQPYFRAIHEYWCQRKDLMQPALDADTGTIMAKPDLDKLISRKIGASAYRKVDDIGRTLLLKYSEFDENQGRQDRVMTFDELCRGVKVYILQTFMLAMLPIASLDLATRIESTPFQFRDEEQAHMREALERLELLPVKAVTLDVVQELTRMIARLEAELCHDNPWRRKLTHAKCRVLRSGAALFRESIPDEWNKVNSKREALRVLDGMIHDKAICRHRNWWSCVLALFGLFPRATQTQAQLLALRDKVREGNDHVVRRHVGLD